MRSEQVHRDSPLNSYLNNMEDAVLQHSPVLLPTVVCFFAEFGLP